MRRPLMAAALGFALGVTAPRAGAVVPAALAAVVLSLSPPLAPLGFASAGWAAASAASGGSAPRRQPTGESIVEGRVASVPDRLGEHVRFVLRARTGELLLATTRQLPWPLALGDEVRLEARLRVPEGRRNPGGRDRAADLAARGIALEAYATSIPVRMAAPSLLSAIEAGRDRFADAAARALPAREAGLLRAIATGDRSGVDRATSDSFARSGLAHLLSVSGLHLAVVAFGAHRALAWLLARWHGFAVRFDPRRFAAAASFPLTFLYAVGTGADTPVVRSALAAAVAFGGLLLDREVDALNVLSFAALGILAFDPSALRDVSFQLSFASVAGLALWSTPLRRAIPLPRDLATRFGRVREMLLAALCASAAATIATAPIVAIHFRRLSLAGVVSNLVGVPLGSALTVAGAVASAASAVAPSVAAALLQLCYPLAALLLAVSDLAAAPSWAAVGIGSPGIPAALLCYAAMLLAWRTRGLRRTAAALVALTALLLPPHARHALALRRGGLEVTFLSVGQGDATAFLLPDGSAVLVDGGGEAHGHYDPGERDIVPWLRDAGVTRIAAIFLSHPHPDHLLGLPAVAAAFPVEHFFTNGRTGDDMTAAALTRLPPAEVLQSGASFERAGVRFDVLAPAGDHDAWTENDASLVLRVSHGAVTLLLCGDIEAEGEAALTAAVPAALLHADVVKIPHHGSATSSGDAIVAMTRPSYAIACVGHDNRFGFPSADVVERWRAGGAAVLRTDGGAIRFLSNGRGVRRAAAEASLDGMALAHEAL